MMEQGSPVIQNHSLCTFQTGKRYNCDLSAAYNIGARYFIRELLKPLPVTERSLLEAKVPPVKRRTSCVYADLKELIYRNGDMLDYLKPAGINAGRYTGVDYLTLMWEPAVSGTGNVHDCTDLSYRCIRRYLV